MILKLMDLLAMISERIIFLFHFIGIRKKLDILVFKQKLQKLIKERQISKKEKRVKKKILSNKKTRRMISHQVENS
jgi:hypothetical protein